MKGMMDGWSKSGFKHCLQQTKRARQRAKLKKVRVSKRQIKRERVYVWKKGRKRQENKRMKGKVTERERAKGTK